MNKKEIIIFGSLTIVFVLTNLLLRDLINYEGIAVAGVVGMGSGLFAFWWSFRFIINKPQSKQILYTTIYCSLLLVIAFVHSRKNKTLKQYSKVTNMDSVNIKHHLIGKWVSPSSRKDDFELTFHFISEDSLIARISNEKRGFRYRIKNADRLLVMGENNQVRLNWLISKLDSDSLIMGDGEQVIKFVREQTIIDSLKNNR
jgi:hypothetical protein